MGKELQMARQEEEGQSVLLAIRGNGERIYAPSIGNKGKEEVTTPKGYIGGEVKDTKAESQSSGKVERTNPSSIETERRRRDNKDRKPHRGDEGTNRTVRRSAKELGIVHPGSYCDELETVPHYWIDAERIAGGVLFQCKYCLRYLWLPMSQQEATYLGKLMSRYGTNEGYCRYLNTQRPAKILMAKLQDLRRLQKETADNREFARLADKILSEKEYDR